MGKKKIIILYSTGGLGHKKAAFALFKAFQKRSADVDVEIMDVLEYANGVYRFVYLHIYVFMMSRVKAVWGALYRFSNAPLVDKMTRRSREVLDFMSLPGLGKALVERSPDAIVATHFLLPSIAWWFKRNKHFHARLFTLITDYGPHNWWLSDNIDRFFVGAEVVAEEMTKRSVPSEKITVTGIPTGEEFMMHFDAGELAKKYGLDRERKTIFIMSGGFGVGPIARILFSLNSCKAEIQVIAVCGHNKTAYRNIQLLQNKLDYPLILFAFTDKVAELMRVSDIMITKAGGISVTEALNVRLPMILFASVPGQETWNEELLAGNGAAEKAKKVDEIPGIVDRVLLSHEAYASLMAGIDRIRRPDAAEKVVDAVLGEIGKDEG
jgi:processive 1,2-diacylglycerol beta-glucosyltransferase